MNKLFLDNSLAPIIDISSKVVGNNLELVFKDNGLGMDLNNKGMGNFGLYKRFHNHIEGKGMGIFMVKKQVESLGGQIYASSEINAGTTFTLVFSLEGEL